MIESKITDGVLTRYKADKDVKEITLPNSIAETGEEAFSGTHRRLWRTQQREY